jgi:hypothetical protein
MGGVGFCGPQVQLLGFPMLVLLCMKGVASRMVFLASFCRHVRRMAAFYHTGIAGPCALPFLTKRGRGPTGTFLFWLCDKDDILSQLLDTSLFLGDKGIANRAHYLCTPEARYVRPKYGHSQNTSQCHI